MMIMSQIIDKDSTLVASPAGTQKWLPTFDLSRKSQKSTAKQPAITPELEAVEDKQSNHSSEVSASRLTSAHFTTRIGPLPDQQAQGRNYYFKQLNSMEKGQAVVISHPYDLSHTLYQQKSFFCPKRRPLLEKLSPRPTHYQQKFLKQTPREMKQAWLNRATALRFDHTKSRKASALRDSTAQTLRVRKLSLCQQLSGRKVSRIKRVQNSPLAARAVSTVRPSVATEVTYKTVITPTNVSKVHTKVTTAKLEPSQSDQTLLKSGLQERNMHAIYDQQQPVRQPFGVRVRNKNASGQGAEFTVQPPPTRRPVGSILPKQFGRFASKKPTRINL